MNRKQKIVVSIVGITIVMLALFGITYAYYLTRIQGNTNTNSISVSTANLELVYGDGSNEVITAQNILPGTNIGTKDFTVTSNSNTNVEYGVYLEDIVNELERKEDLVYYLTCTTETATCSGVGNEENPVTYPELASQIVTNVIEPNVTHNYELTVKYLETNTDQSVDMNKRIEGKVQIHALSDIVDLNLNLINVQNGYYVEGHSETKTSRIKMTGDTTGVAILPGMPAGEHTIMLYNKEGNKLAETKVKIEKGISERVIESSQGKPATIVKTDTSEVVNADINYSGVSLNLTLNGFSYNTPFENGTLADAIIKNTKSGTNGTIYSPIPLTKPAKKVSGENEKTLSITEDDYGKSYYYRGGVENNYVNFANKCWRIVRIQGDGSTKLILEDKNAVCESNSYTGNWNLGNGNWGYDATSKDSSNSTINKKAYLNPVTNADSALINKFKSFQTSFGNKIEYLKSGDWCMNDKAYSDESGTTQLSILETLSKYTNKERFYYDSYVRLNGKTTMEPTLKCNGTVMNKYVDNTDMYVATLTAEEISYAGGKVYITNPNYYLINNWQKNNSKYWWALSPFNFDGYSNNVFIVRFDGYIIGSYVNGSYIGSRPSVSLKSSVKIFAGDGTKMNPYILIER